MNIIKRNGQEVPFNEMYIRNAITKAFIECKMPLTDNVWNQIFTNLSFWDKMSVEDIQDQVIETLEDLGYIEIANKYSTYREDRAILRSQKDLLIKKIGAKLLATNVENSNANLDETSFGGRMGEAASETAKDYALNYCMSEMSRENHLNNEIYIHDLNSYSIGQPNCLLLPLSKLLNKTVKTRQTDIRAANAFSTAIQLVAVYMQIQSLQQFGGIASGTFDWDLVPFVRKSFRKHWITGYKWIRDDETIPEFSNDAKDTSIEDAQYKEFKRVYDYAMDMLNKEITQSIEALYHNLNSLQSRSGNQLFINCIWLGIK